MVCNWGATVQQPKEKIQIHFGLSAELPKPKHPIQAPAFSDFSCSCEQTGLVQAIAEGLHLKNEEPVTSDRICETHGLVT